MSKSAKQSIFILMFLLIGSLVFSGISIFHKEEIVKEKRIIAQKLTDNESKLLQEESKVEMLNEKIETIKEKNKVLKANEMELKGLFESSEKKAEELSKKFANASGDRDKWRRRLDTITQERDALVLKLQDASKPKIVYKEKIIYKEQDPAPRKEIDANSIKKHILEPKPKKVFNLDDVTDDEYWASVLRDKATLEIEVDALKEELSENSIEIIGLKEGNANLNIEIEKLQREKEDINRNVNKIKEEYDIELAALKVDLKKVRETKGALINNLSLELARTKNDNKYISDRNKKIKEESNDLRKHLKELVTTKGALEKSIVMLKKEKTSIEKKLEEREGVIQSKINEIWQIKETLDETFRSTHFIKDEKKVSDSNNINLSPIHVIASEEEEEEMIAAPVSPGYSGEVISLNEDNNFVIVDIGEDDGITLGETLGIYRDSQHIASLEVIQIRKDISAADVKEQNGRIKKGDIVR